MTAYAPYNWLVSVKEQMGYYALFSVMPNITECFKQNVWEIPLQLLSLSFIHHQSKILIYHFDTSDQKKPQDYMSHMALTTERYQVLPLSPCG